MLAVGDKRPLRVRIELLADEWQGERRWVPPARLEVLWEDRHEYIEFDRRLRAVQAWTPERLERRTAEHVFIKLIPLEIAEFNADVGGTSVIHDVPATARLLGLSQDELRADPAVLHDGELIVPWPTTELMVRTAATKFPDKLLTEIEAEERKLNEDMLNGTVLTDLEGNDHHLGPVEVRAMFEKHRRPHLDKLREWIGVERATDMLERRELLIRLGQAASVAGRALDALEPSQKRIVAKLRGELAAALDGVNTLPPSSP
ncbi:hypothetical protein [Curtobacterium sp. ISL-83]|uniref:hypothetical protein n=1 Tax=Curtobacterium sp. ISL-83 TaxID=2819145 RepID=UPI001BE58CFD|nr:hypothetical protein [Curtobacterium sp. ISL-83]MBT2501427.1 hypothetical protein [Curtobacterium sp. ISL-83]